MFRTAYSVKSPPKLRETIITHYGLGRGLMLAPSTQRADAQLEYRPLRVLSENEIEGLAHGTKDFYGW